MTIPFLSYGKAVSISLVVFIHFCTAFFNANDAWAFVVRAPKFVDREYPLIIRWIGYISFDAVYGFLVVGAVCFFLLASGFTVMKSLENRNILQFWRHKFFRLVPFYVTILFFNMMIAAGSSYVWHIDFHHKLIDILAQLLLGLQYLVPNAVSLDPVIWFLGVDLIFYIFASLMLKRTSLRKILYFDVLLVSIIFVVRFICLEMNCGFFTYGNISFFIKAVCLSIYISIATMFSLHYFGKISLKALCYSVLGQYLLFLLVYRWNIHEINYVDQNSYITWFSCYLLVFWLLYLYSKR